MRKYIIMVLMFIVCSNCIYADDYYLPVLAETSDTWDSYIFIANSTSTSINASVFVYDLNGNQIGTTLNLSLEGNEKLTVLINDSVFGSGISSAGLVTGRVWTSGSAYVAGLAYVSTGELEGEFLLYDSSSGQNSKLATPHTNKLSTFSSYLFLQNPTDSNISVTLRGFLEDGESVGNRVLQLPPRSASVDLVENYIENLTSSGWIEIDAGSDSIVSQMVYYNSISNVDSWTTTVCQRTEQGNTSMNFPLLFTSNNEWLSYLMLINPNNTNTVATVVFYDTNGSETGYTDLSLPARSKLIIEISDSYFPNDLPNGDRVSVFVASTDEISSYAVIQSISGSTDRDITIIPAQTQSAQRDYFPLVLKDTYYETWLVVMNATRNNSTRVDCYLYDDDGNRFDDTQFLLSTGEIKEYNVADLFSRTLNFSAALELVAENDHKIQSYIYVLQEVVSGEFLRVYVNNRTY